MNEVKFVAFADLHHAAGYYNHATERLAQILAHAEEVDADLVLHCGDLCHGPTLVPEIIEQCDAFPRPILHSLGNHECDGSTHEEALAAYHMERGYYYRDIKGFRFIAYDANQMNVNGEIVPYSMKNYWHPPVGIRQDDTIMETLGDEQLRWLEETIMASPYPCVLFGHHSFQRIRTDIPLEEQDRIRAMLKRVNEGKRRVMMVMIGHYHVDHLEFLDGIPHWELNSASNYYMGQAHDEFPEEITSKAPGARHNLIWNEPLHAVVTLRDDGTVKVEGMDGTHFMGVSMRSLGRQLDDPSRRVIDSKISSFSFKLDME